MTFNSPFASSCANRLPAALLPDFLFPRATRTIVNYLDATPKDRQVLDIQISGNRLVYRAYDIDGNLKDEFVIEK